MTDTPLAAWRKRAGLTQKQLATLAGVTQAQVSKLETGVHAPGGMRTAQKLAAALGVSLDALWGPDAPTTRPTHHPRRGAVRARGGR